MSDIEKVLDPLDPEGLQQVIGRSVVDDLFPDEWSLEQVETAKSELFKDGRINKGFYSKIPRRCSDSCPYEARGQCPLSKKPRKALCPEEAAFVEMLMRGYVQSLNISREDLVSLSMVRDLVDVEIQILRKQGDLANEAFLVEKEFFDRSGQVVGSELVENPLVSTDDKLNKRKRDILKTLAGTREQKLKYLGDLAKTDTMERVARLLEENLTRQNQGEIIDVDPDEIPEVDPFFGDD